METGATVVPVMLRAGAAVVEATPGISERVVCCVVSFFVVAGFQSVAADVGTDVVGATWRVGDVGNAKVVAGDAGLVCRVASVVDGGDVSL